MKCIQARRVYTAWKFGLLRLIRSGIEVNSLNSPQYHNWREVIEWVYHQSGSLTPRLVESRSQWFRQAGFHLAPRAATIPG